jgi:predicted nucleic acid-binding Zn ribbon protein
MPLFTDGQIKRHCEVCGKLYRPRVPDQRFCGFYCRDKQRKRDAKAARRTWWFEDKPSLEQAERMLKEKRQHDAAST